MSKKKTKIEEITTAEVVVVEETKTAKRGRPTVENSARQARLAARAARLAAGGELKKGRPANPNSARQLKITKRQEAMVSGIEIKRGRPKVEKAQVTEEVA